MNLKGFENLVLAVASEMKDNRCIEEILNKQHFILPLMDWRNKKLAERMEEGKADPGVFDDLLDFITCEFTPTAMSRENFKAEIQGNSRRILHNFHILTRSELVTNIAARNYALDIVSRQIMRSNTMRSGSAHIAARANIIKDMFLDQFRRESAHAFQFEGTLLSFVANSFLRYFWKPHLSDIWKILRDSDVLKLETEKNILNIVEVEEVSNEDLMIGPLLQNTYKASEKMFSHSGHSSNVRGILCDLYFIVMSLLCEQQVDQLNRLLQLRGCDYHVQYINTYSYTVSKAQDLGVPQFTNVNKGMAAKVANATEIVEVILQAIKERRISKESLFDLSLQCFDKGKKDIEGKNSVWKSYDKLKTTITRLGEQNAINNYTTFDTVLKGVLSVYTLMTKLQERGKSIAGEYVPDIFRDADVVRSIMYYSDISEIPLIRRMQANGEMAVSDCPLALSDGNGPAMLCAGEETSVPPTDIGGLRTFEMLVKDIAGSEHNGHGDIKENRKRAIQEGLLGVHRRKKSSAYVDEYSQISSLASGFTALPREYAEHKDFAGLIAEGDKMSEVPEHAPLITGKQYSACHVDIWKNIYLIEHPDVANTLLYRGTTIKDGHFDLSRWSVASAQMDGVYFTDGSKLHLLGLYNPMREVYVTEVGGDEETPLSLFTSGDFTSYYNQYRTTNPGMQVSFCKVSSMDAELGRVKHFSMVENYQKQAENSLGFDTYLGIDNLKDSNVVRMMQRLPVYDRYRQQLLVYLHQYGELSNIQISLCNLAKIIFIESVQAMYEKENPVNAMKGYNVFKSCLQSSFNVDGLNYILELIWAHYESKGRTFKTNLRGQHGQFFTAEKIDMQALEWVMGDMKTPSTITYKVKGDPCVVASVYKELNKLVEDIESRQSVRVTPAGKFVLLFNFIDNKIKFIRYLRDAMEILFCLSKMSLSSFMCEMDYVFNITGGIIDFVRNGQGNHVALNTISDSEMEAFITSVRRKSYETFKVTFDAVRGYVNGCAEDLNSLMEYNILTGGSIKEELKQWGAGFNIQPKLPGAHDILPDFLTLTDEFGFYRLHGSYVKATIRDANYYIHRTGRILMERMGVVDPLTLDLNNQRDKEFYKNIVREAVWTR